MPGHPDDRGLDDAEGALDPFWVDRNGVLTERSCLGGQEVIIHYDDVPECDITTLRGIPCTTPLRTVIDLAPEVGRSHLELMVRDCLDRHLFTLDEAWARLAQPDVATRAGAALVRDVLTT